MRLEHNLFKIVSPRSLVMRTLTWRDLGKSPSLPVATVSCSESTLKATVVWFLVTRTTSFRSSTRRAPFPVVVLDYYDLDLKEEEAAPRVGVNPRENAINNKHLL